MRRVISILLVVLLCVQLAACGSGAGDAPPVPTDTADFIAPSAVVIDEDATPDVDLTTLSSTMVYAEVFNMMVEPENYVGKTIKAKGEFYVIQNAAPERNYYMLLIRDALACCSQGLEFYPTGGQEFPADFPAYASEIELTGTFTAYDRNGVDFYYIVCDSFSIL